MKIVGTVVKGEGFALMAFGLPTANLDINEAVKLEPGTYASYTNVGAERFNSIVYVGPKGSEKFEAHLLGFAGELYGQTLEIEILELVSPYVPWESEEQMKAKVAGDVALAKEYFKL